MTHRIQPSIGVYEYPTVPAWLTVGGTATAATGSGAGGYYYFEAQTGIINIVWSAAGATAATTTTGIQLDTAKSGEAKIRIIRLRPGEKFTAIADGASKVLLWSYLGEVI